MDDLFWARVDVGDCWRWTGAADPLYGVLQRDGKMHKAHRYAWEMLIGTIPDGMHLDHVCRDKRCVNPDHLEVITPKENSIRRSRRPFCRRGHRIAGRNVITAEGKRRCRECSSAAKHRWKERNAAG